VLPLLFGILFIPITTNCQIILYHTNVESSTLKIQSILESHISQQPGSSHPGLLHLYIHLMEMSPIPSHALLAANALLSIAKDLPHLIHMPSHIYIQNGDYASAISSNQAAVKADEKYQKKSGNLPYNSIYRCHDFHFMGWAAMFAGNWKTAVEAADGIERCFPREFLGFPGCMFTSAPELPCWLLILRRC
jgi:hypothetical protein